MKTRILIIGVFISLVFLNACHKNSGEANPEDEPCFIFGRFFGECTGNCFVAYKLENEKLFVDDEIYFEKSSDIKFMKQVLDNSKKLIAEELLKKFPPYLINHTQTTFGCPDCVDQGGYLLIRNINGQKRMWTLDYCQISEVDAYLMEINAAMSKL